MTRPRRRPGETVAVPTTSPKAPVSNRAKEFDPGKVEDQSKRSGPRRVPEVDMIWEVTCEDCPVSWLSRSNSESGATVIAGLHKAFRPGHRAGYHQRKGRT